jgi:parallel beta-helix repeat protein
VDGVEIDHNGNPNELGRGGGGIKIAAKADDVDVRNSYVHDNIGNGIWYDIEANAVDSDFIYIENNFIERNTRKGIFYEISGGPVVIRNNVVKSNNCAVVIAGCTPQGEGSPGGGITANSSTNLKIYDNVLGGNAVAGINFRDDNRPEGGTMDQNGPGCCNGYTAPFNISVHDNKLNGDRVLKCGTLGVTCSRNS